MVDKETLKEVKELLDSSEAKAIKEYYSNDGHNYQMLSILLPDKDNNPQLKIIHVGETISVKEFMSIAKSFYKNATEEKIMQTLYILTNRNLAIYLGRIKSAYEELTDPVNSMIFRTETTEIATGKKWIRYPVKENEDKLSKSYNEYKKLLPLYKKMSITKTEFPEAFNEERAKKTLKTY